MMRILLFLVFSTAAALLAAWFADHPGRVLVEWMGVEIETSFALLFLAVLLLVLLGVVAFEIVHGFVTLPRRLRERRARKRLERGYQALTTGLVAAAAGDLANARYYARQAARLLDGERAGLLLLTAQTAQLEGNDEEALRRFRAMLKEPETHLLGLRGLLAHAMKDGDLDRALELAREAYRRSPSTPWVLTTLFDLLTRAERWEEALAHLGELVDAKLLTPSDARRKRAIMLSMMARAAERAERLGEAFELARRAFRTAPGFAPLAVHAAKLATRLGRDRLARRILERAWRAEPHPDLARAYAALVPDEPPLARAKRLERLRSLRPYDALSYLVLGEAYLVAGEFREARHLLGRARELGPTVRLYQLLADLELLETGDEARAQEWLEKALDAPLDRAWMCRETGEILPEWKPFGGNGGFDAVHWVEPPRVARLPAELRPTRYLVGERPSPARAMVPREEAAPPAPTSSQEKDQSPAQGGAVGRRAAAADAA